MILLKVGFTLPNREDRILLKPLKALPKNPSTWASWNLPRRESPSELVHVRFEEAQGIRISLEINSIRPAEPIPS